MGTVIAGVVILSTGCIRADAIASLIADWVCRNCRHVMSVCRSGAGGIFSAFRTRRIVDAPTW
jgi:hypothetical protein